MNITECVKKYGKTSFQVQPFGEVDSLILSELSYLDYSFLPKFGFATEFIDLKQYIDEMCAMSVHPRDSVKLLKALFNSERYANIKIGYFKEVIDETLPKRFAAVSFEINDFIYVAFRGTDITIVGWQEDLNLMYLNTIPSQEEAVIYLAEIMEKENGRFFVGGHSKGGNLAVYASVKVNKELQDRIEVIYDHDGPGFHENIFESQEFTAIKDRIKKTVPRDSIIGMLLEHYDRYTVVKCQKTMLDQHDPFTWQVVNFESFNILPKTSNISQRASIAICNWLNGMSIEERKSFVTALFRIILSTGKRLVKDFTKFSLSEIRKMWSEYRKLSQAEQNLVKAGGRLLFEIRLRTVGKKSIKETKAINKNTI